MNIAVKPHTELRAALVHPKDKNTIEDTSGIFYEIPCNSCEKSYVGETCRLFGTRKGEHKDESDKISQKNFTRAARKESETQEIKSAVVQHVADVNHVIDWEGSGILAKESVKGTRGIRESI